jgi:hypothetical protein
MPKTLLERENSVVKRVPRFQRFRTNAKSPIYIGRQGIYVYEQWNFNQTVSEVAELQEQLVQVFARQNKNE